MMEGEPKSEVHCGGTKIEIDLMPVFWAVMLAGAFVFGRGCDGTEKSVFDRWLEAAYPSCSQQVSQ